MSAPVPTVSIIVAARPGQSEIRAVNAAVRLAFPSERLELIVARGRQPSAQRNAALSVAKGDWVYFLDDDSEAEPGNLDLAMTHMGKDSVQMVGGPNVCPPTAPWLEQVFALVLASWLAFGPSRARYAGIGQARASSEKELILCNLLARRATMLDLGGFNEALYPNEENALMDEIQKRGGVLMYDPAMLVYRRPRSSLSAFAKMLLTYGRGRAEQFRLHPTPGSALNFVPPLFCVYLLGLSLTLLLAPGIGKFLLPPLGFYALAVLAQCAWLAQMPTFAPKGQALPERVTRRLPQALATIPLIVLTHLLYGLGFWRGLLTKLRTNPQKKAEVLIERRKEFGTKVWTPTTAPSPAQT